MNTFDYKCAKEIDPIRSALAKIFHHKLHTCFSLDSLSESDIFQSLEKPPEASLGDYSFPCFKLAKPLRQNPAVIAQKVQESFDEKEKKPWIQDLKCVGAFLNIFIDKKEFADTLISQTLSGKSFELPLNEEKNQKSQVMVEYSQPNTHKEFHIGHARNVCLGDSLCRIYRYLGYKVIAANYYGDEGTHVAKCLWQVMKEGASAPEDEVNKSHWYGQRYIEANRALEEADPAKRKVYEKEISSILSDLEAKRGKAYEIYLKSRKECVENFKHIYSWMDAHFDHDFYESHVSEDAQSIVDEYIKKGLFKESEGAIGIDLTDSKLGFFMARKSDGTTPYITKDLALARKKFQDFQITESIYVVGSEQNFHFQQLFKALELMGFKQAKDCYHLNYAHVKLKEGKMSSRTGNALSFAFLRDELLKELAPYLEKYKNDWSEEEILSTADKLAIGAIRYGMLSSDPGREIIFDIKLWTSFEGNTGPYLMYSYARTHSILLKAESLGLSRNRSSTSALSQYESAHLLLRLLSDFNQTVYQACVHHKPSILANNLYDMCKAFNRFYAEVPILKSKSDDEKSALLNLVDAFSKTLHKGLFLLGITAPERM